MACTLACARSWSRCSRSFVDSSPALNMVPSFPVVSLDVPASSVAAQGGGGVSTPNPAALAATFRLKSHDPAPRPTPCSPFPRRRPHTSQRSLLPHQLLRHRTHGTSTKPLRHRASQI